MGDELEDSSLVRREDSSDDAITERGRAEGEEECRRRLRKKVSEFMGAKRAPKSSFQIFKGHKNEIG